MRSKHAARVIDNAFPFLKLWIWSQFFTLLWRFLLTPCFGWRSCDILRVDWWAIYGGILGLSPRGVLSCECREFKLVDYYALRLQKWFTLPYDYYFC